MFSEHTRAPYEGRARSFTEYGASVDAGADDVLLYHAAIGSVVADWLLERRPARLVVDYHNITPPEWFMAWEPDLAYGLGWGRAQLRTLARRTRFGIADSAFNAAELAAAGVRRTAVLPILIPPESLHGAADAPLVERLRSQAGTRWLFVGRLAPNKRQHLLIAALSVFRRVYDPAATLVLVGASSSPGLREGAAPLQRRPRARARRHVRRHRERRRAQRLLHGGRRVRLPLRPRGVPGAAAGVVAPPAPDRRVRVHRRHRDARHRRSAPSDHGGDDRRRRRRAGDRRSGPRRRPPRRRHRPRRGLLPRADPGPAPGARRRPGRRRRRPAAHQLGAPHNRGGR